MLARPWIALLFAMPCCAADTFYLAPEVYNALDPTARDTELAATLYAEAHAASEEGRLSLALRLVSQALHHDPDHADARRVLGYQRVDGRWQTPFEAKQSKRGYRWDRRYGWYKPADLPRFEAGERPAGKRWVTAQVDADRHADIDKGWQVRTDHFVVTTTHSPRMAAAMAAELEMLRQVWQQLLAGYDLTSHELQQRFTGERTAPRLRRPMRVFYHRDKAGYVEHLRRRQPRIAETLGIYFDTIREAHFYHSDDPKEAARLRSTLYHEATHQLLQETSPKARSVGVNANFWVVEGIACYFETLVSSKDRSHFTIGDLRHGRLPSARAQASPLPIAELTALGMSDLQRHPDLAALYAQSTALVAMLIEKERPALVRYLQAVYGGRPDGGELAQQVGRNASRLDAEYREFLGTIPPSDAAER